MSSRQRAREACAAAGDLAGEARVMVHEARALANLLRSSEALAMLQAALPRFESLVGTPEHASVLLRIASAYWIEDELGPAVEWADRALVEAERHDLVETIVDGLIVKGGSLGYLGRGYEGISTMRGAYALAEAHGIEEGMLRALANLSDAQIARDPRAALQTARSGLERVRRLGRADYLGILVLNGTYAAIRTGDWDWAIEESRNLATAAIDEHDRASGVEAMLPIAAARGEDVDDRLAEIERILGTAQRCPEPGQRASTRRATSPSSRAVSTRPSTTR